MLFTPNSHFAYGSAGNESRQGHCSTDRKTLQPNEHDIRGVVGTSNLDFRSLYLHFECCMYMYKNETVFDIEKDYQETLKQSQEITVKDCDEYSGVKKIAGSLLRFIAPLM